MSILLCCANLKAQIIEDTTYSSSIGFREQSFGLLNLTSSQVPSGFLLEYSLVDFLSEKYDGVGTPVDTIYSYREFLYLYNILEQAKVNANGVLTPTNDLFLAASRRKRGGGIPFTFLLQSYERVNPGALAANLLAVSADDKRLMDVAGRTASPYLTKEIFLFAPFETDVSSSEAIGFTFPAQFWQMAGVSAVTVDFGDGGGPRFINKGDSIGVYYATSGTKYITATIQTPGGTRTAKSMIHYTRPKFYFKADQSVNIQTSPVYTSTSQYVGVQTIGALGAQDPCSSDNVFSQRDCDIQPGANIQVMLSCDKIFDRPVIIVEGFDVDNSVGLNRQFEHFDRYNFLTQLFSQGHDIVFVNLRKPGDFIENNAKVLEQVINWVNQQKTGNFRGSVIGFSMGGLIARWCLKDMEDRSIDHKIAHYFSYDAPHQGANIPLGLQYILREMTIDFPYLRWSWPWGKPIAGGVRGLLEAYESPAARQMLVAKADYAGEWPLGSTLDPVREVFAQRLANKGYPQLAVSHGISMGRGNNTAGTRNAGNGAQFGFGPGSKIFDGELSYLLVNMQCAAYAVPDGNTDYIARYRFAGYTVRRLFGFIHVAIPTIRSRNIKLTGSYPYDDAPGSYESSQTIFMQSLNDYRGLGSRASNMGHHGHAFVPTASALDLTNQSYGAGNKWQSANMFFNIDNFIAPAQSTAGNQLTNPALSPFDFVHTYTSDCNDVPAISCESLNDDIDGDNFWDVRADNWNQYHNGWISDQAAMYIVRKILGAFPNQDCENTCSANTVINGPAVLCSNDWYWVNLNSQGVQLLWESLSPLLVTVSSGQQSSTARLSRVPNANGIATVRLTITNPCGVTRVITRQIRVGSPMPTYNFVGADEDHGFIEVLMDSDPTYSGYNYYLDGVLKRANQTGDGIKIPRREGCGFWILEVEGINICGTSPKARYDIDFPCHVFKVSPNPASDRITVSAITAEELHHRHGKAEVAFISEVRLYDIQSKLVKTEKGGSAARLVHVNALGLPSGVYVLEVWKGKEKEVHKVLITR